MLMKICANIKSIQLAKYHTSKASEEKRNEILTDPVTIIKRAVENATPLMAIQNVTVGSVQYKVPVPISESR